MSKRKEERIIKIKELEKRIVTLNGTLETIIIEGGTSLPDINDADVYTMGYRNTETLFEYEVAYAAPRFVRVADGGVVLDLPVSLWTEQYYLIVGNTADGYVPNKKEAAAV